MKKGDNKYRHLPNLYVILITDFDLFGDGQRLYTFQHRCLESPEVTYEDGLRILYFNTKGTKGGSQSVQNMLNYLQESKATSVVEEATREIDGYVRGVKENPKAEEAYMTIGDIIDREVEEAVGKAVEEAVENNTRQVTRYTKVNDILELLGDADGDISDALKEELVAVTDPEQLKSLFLVKPRMIYLLKRRPSMA
jgi:predicted transposase/invertase (TIGR01784 family)